MSDYERQVTFLTLTLRIKHTLCPAVLQSTESSHGTNRSPGTSRQPACREEENGELHLPKHSKAPALPGAVSEE